MYYIHERWNISITFFAKTEKIWRDIADSLTLCHTTNVLLIQFTFCTRHVTTVFRFD